MARRNRKNKPKVFSTSLLDMLFCAFGGVYTLFVIGAALLSAISFNLPMLITAQIVPESNNLNIDEYLRDSYLTFGLSGEYLDETKNDIKILAHYGYLNYDFTQDTRKSYLFLNEGLNQEDNSIQLYAENFDLPLFSSFTTSQQKSKVNINLQLFIEGKKYIDNTKNLEKTIAEIYQNQLPSSKEKMEPLLNLKLIIEDDQLRFK